MANYIIPSVTIIIISALVWFGFQYLKNDKPEDDSAKDQSRILRFLLVPLFFIIISCYLYSLGQDSFATSFAILLSIGFGALLIGCLIGFLFGIPKTKAALDKENEDSEFDIRLPNVNTNLEEISDWLTKILIGVGIVELIQLTKYLKQLTSSIAKDSLAPKPLVIGLIAGMGIIGFFTGYLFTRLFLSTAFYRSLYRNYRNEAETDAVDDIMSEFVGATGYKSLEEYLNEITSRQKDLLTILKKDGAYFIPKDFQRHSTLHEDYRALKSKRIIRIKEGGSMKPGKTIESTGLGKAFLKYWNSHSE
ncbi:MAG: hypothetical protein AAGG59_08180 [Bacteroidota bacterium]